MFVPGSAEFFNMNKRQIADRPEVTTFFERMTFLPLEHITAMVPRAAQASVCTSSRLKKPSRPRTGPPTLSTSLTS